MKKILRLAVTNVHFNYKGIWYVQSDGLAIGALLAAILAKNENIEFQNVQHLKKSPKMAIYKS